MRSFIQIQTGLRCAIRIARRLMARHLAVIVNSPLHGLAYRQRAQLPVLLPVRQHEPLRMNSSEPLAAPVRLHSHAASGRHFL
ncbi:hypothetical protein [Paraburkholderia phenoliruptrix]|uniref:hypothetical protein n=1 Tax=Paraburkholderia phenoliruptrix TaxID=252970 RepID=UPI003D97346C